MINSIDFFKSVNQNLVSELDILNFIDDTTKNDFFKLEQLNKDLETFEVDFISKEVVESYFNVPVYNPKTVSELFKKFKTLVSNKLETKNTNEINKHPKHDPNLWNSECFDLFKYLFDEYHKGTNRQLTNIWFYLKEYQSPKYVLKATKNEFIKFIKDNYQIEIKNKDKAYSKYAEKEYPTMNEHRINFESNLK